MEGLFWIIPVGHYPKDSYKENTRKSETESEAAGFEDGGRNLSQGMMAVSKSWKMQGNRFCPRASRRNPALLTP